VKAVDASSLAARSPVRPRPAAFIARARLKRSTSGRREERTCSTIIPSSSRPPGLPYDHGLPRAPSLEPTPVRPDDQLRLKFALMTGRIDWVTSIIIERLCEEPIYYAVDCTLQPIVKRSRSRPARNSPLRQIR
jgi:hypothetical protein